MNTIFVLLILALNSANCKDLESWSCTNKVDLVYSITTSVNLTSKWIKWSLNLTTQEPNYFLGIGISPNPNLTMADFVIKRFRSDDEEMQPMQDYHGSADGIPILDMDFSTNDTHDWKEENSTRDEALNVTTIVVSRPFRAFNSSEDRDIEDATTHLIWMYGPLYENLSANFENATMGDIKTNLLQYTCGGVVNYISQIVVTSTAMLMLINA